MRVRDGGESNREGNCAVDWMQAMLAEGEQPLDRLADGYSNTAIFRTIGFIGDSLSSGEFESRDKDGKMCIRDRPIVAHKPRSCKRGVKKSIRPDVVGPQAPMGSPPGAGVDPE